MASRRQSEESQRGRGEVQRDRRGLRGLRRPGKAQEVRRSRPELAASLAASRTAAPLPHQRRRTGVRVRFRRPGRPKRVLRFLRHVFLRGGSPPDGAGPAARAHADRIWRRRSTSACATSTKAARKPFRSKSRICARAATAPAPRAGTFARNATARDASCSTGGSKSRSRRGSATVNASGLPGRAAPA